MSPFIRPIFFRSLVLQTALLAAGCMATFSQHDAREVSRERLLELSEAGRSDHLLYEGSDFYYHYVYDARRGKERSYKVRADGMTLRETFPVGDDSYVLHPWVIEGQPFGSKTEETPTSEPPAADDH
jgi:hypothetical protein